MGRIYHDSNFIYTDCERKHAVADLQVFYRDDERTIVVISELTGASGCYETAEAPLTHAINRIATVLAKKMGIDFDYLIEHYPLREGMQARVAETFDLVPLQWNRPAEAFRVVQMPVSWPWTHVNHATAEAIIGEPFSMTEA